MKVKFNVQRNGVNTLKEKFELHSNSDLKKTYMIIGNIKDTGFDILEEFLIDLKARKYFLIGIDKKNTTRRMLEELCKYTKNVYVHNNNYDDELDGSVYVFEYTKKATVYTTGGSMSLSSFVTDVSCYVETEFDLENIQDKEEYKEFIDGITKESKSEEFVQIDKAYVARLVEEKEIFSTKQYTHNVLSISELLGKSANEVKEKVEDLEEAPKSMPKIDLNSVDFSMDIDLGESNKEEEIPKVSEEKNIVLDNLKEKEIDPKIVEKSVEDIPETTEDYEVSDEVIDMENMLFEKADIKLKKNKREEKEAKEENKNRKVDLEKVSNLFIELPVKNNNLMRLKYQIILKI